MTKAIIDLGGQFSVPISGVTKKQGETLPRRHPLVESKPIPKGYSTSSSTFYELVIEAFYKFSSRNFLGHRTKVRDEQLGDIKYGPYVWETYEEIQQRMINFSVGLSHLGLEQKCNVGIYFVNRPEWVIADLACQRMGYVSVPLYDTLGEDSMTYIVKQTELATVIATKDNVSKLLKLCKEQNISHLNRIIVVDEDQEMNDGDVKIISWKDVEDLGKQHFSEHLPASQDPSNLLTICYTSGTSGDPKGAMLTQRNMFAAVSSLLTAAEIGHIEDINQSDVYLSYLPLAHIFERVVISVIMLMGSSVGFYHGDMMTLTDDLTELKPTLFAGVPRVFNRFHDKVFGTIAEKGFISRFLFSMAYDSKSNLLKKTNSIYHWLWDRLVFSSIKSKFGGRLRLVVSGGAPIDPKVKDFLLISTRSDFVEGYGQTETVGIGSFTLMGDYNTGRNLGSPAPGIEMKLVDVPEFDYFTDNDPPRGEICIKGTNVFTGYYKDPERTAETLDNDGWIHTGDIGEFDSQGKLYIIDRKKSIFKLSQGEYVSPERIECVISRHELVEQAFIYGNSFQSFLIAVIVPDKEAFMRWIKKCSGSMNDHTRKIFVDIEFAQACNHDLLKSMFLKEIDSHCRRAKLKGFENPKAIYLEPEPFSVENNSLTTTFKLRRHFVTNKYRDLLEKIYHQTTGAESPKVDR